jgi:hypothetical protein
MGPGNQESVILFHDPIIKKQLLISIKKLLAEAFVSFSIFYPLFSIFPSCFTAFILDKTTGKKYP